MQKRRLSANFLLVIFGLLLTAGGVAAMRLELAPYLASRGSPTSSLQNLVAGDTGYGLSTSSQEAVLTDCRTAMLSLVARVQPSSVRDGLNQTCLAVSDELAATQPTFSIAWLTGAIAAAQMEDWDGFTERLEHSLRTGGVEQWLAEMRISVAEQYYDRLTDELKAGNAADMLLLTDTDPGLLSLARIYVMSEASRGRITAVVDTTNEVTREKFLRRVRLLSSEMRL